MKMTVLWKQLSKLKIKNTSVWNSRWLISVIRTKFQQKNWKGVILKLKIQQIYNQLVSFFKLKVLYDSFGIPLRTITICLACLSIIHWLRTFFLVPTTRIPSVLPEEGYDLASHSLALKLCGTKTDQSENLPMNEELKKGRKVLMNWSKCGDAF